MSIRYKSGFVLFRSLKCGLFLCIIGLQKCAKSVKYVKFFIYLRTNVPERLPGNRKHLATHIRGEGVVAQSSDMGFLFQMSFINQHSENSFIIHYWGIKTRSEISKTLNISQIKLQEIINKLPIKDKIGRSECSDFNQIFFK